jgi:hypothetical protein
VGAAALWLGFIQQIATRVKNGTRQNRSRESLKKTRLMRMAAAFGTSARHWSFIGAANVV